MRYFIVGAALAAAGTMAAAQAPASKWAYFEPAGQPITAGVVNAEGAQFLLKCDKPGKKSVYAVMVNPAALVPTARDPFLLPTEVRFDEASPQEDRWRFVGNSAMAMNASGNQALTRLMDGLPTASRLRLRMYVERGRTVEVSFDVAGAQEAMTRVYQSCGDDLPS
jgi:hypothetical protein